jgi:hypothetical protein
MSSKITGKFIKAWSIGIYEGDSPFNVREYKNNPILSAKDIKVVPVYFIADPFLVRYNEMSYIFFEMLNASTGRGEIGVASSKDYINWKFEKTVLKEKFHLSYPLVFNWNNNYYMIPESMHDNSIRLYIALNFPYEWSHITNILDHRPYRDSTVIYHDGYWWLYTTYDDNNLLLYYSVNLLSSSWYAHPNNPIVQGRYARPGGRIIYYNNKMIRFSQDLIPIYGSSVVAFEVKKITTNEYEEVKIDPSPFMAPSGKGWNKSRMHHVDCHKTDIENWFVVTDGYSTEINPSISIIINRILQKLRQKIGI